MNNIKDIADKILNCKTYDIPDIQTLASAYLELEKENYRIRCEKQSDLNTISQLQFDLEATEKVYRMNRQYVDDAKSEITKLKEENEKLKQLFAVQLDVIEQNKKLTEEIENYKIVSNGLSSLNETISKDLKMCREIGVEMQREVNRKLSVENDNLKKSREVLRKACEFYGNNSTGVWTHDGGIELEIDSKKAREAIKSDDEIMVVGNG